MTTISIILAVPSILYILFWLPGAGKFWHKHEWYHFLNVETPSIYSKKKINSHDVWKCSKDNCWAFDIITVTLEKDEGIQAG